MKYLQLLLLLAWLVLSGCATNDTSSSDDMQSPSGMSSQGMGRGGGGGGGGGGGHQQGPPDGDRGEEKKEFVLPDEAFTICHDKQVGDIVRLMMPGGESLKATCKLMDDHMVAMPEEQKRPNRERPQ